MESVGLRLRNIPVSLGEKKLELLGWDPKRAKGIIAIINTGNKTRGTQKRSPAGELNRCGRGARVCENELFIMEQHSKAALYKGFTFLYDLLSNPNTDRDCNYVAFFFYLPENDLLLTLHNSFESGRCTLYYITSSLSKSFVSRFVSNKSYLCKLNFQQINMEKIAYKNSNNNI